MEQLKTTIINYSDGIYAVDQQMVRAFLIVGENKALLLDTGAIRTDIVTMIKDITDLPLEVILTHADGDHIGNLQDFPTARINEKDMEAVLSHENCKNVKLLALSENEIIDIGGRKLKVIFTPGHTKGSICLLDEKNKILFAGDTISYGPVFMFGERRNMTDYLSSLKMLRQMKDDGIFTEVFCCHNTCPILADTADDLIACVEGIMENTLTSVPAPMPVPSEEKPYICKFGKCSVLIDAPQNK